jgi:hypothetical protein
VPTIEIVSAHYGTSDVLDNFKMMYEQAMMREFAAEDDMWGAPGGERKLTIVYRMNGSEFRAVAQGDSFATVPHGNPGAVEMEEEGDYAGPEIVSAYFGDLSVVRKLKRNYTSGMRAFKADSAQWGDFETSGDKKLEIHYRFNDVDHREIVGGGDSITLPDMKVSKQKWAVVWLDEYDEDNPEVKGALHGSEEEARDQYNAVIAEFQARIYDSKLKVDCQSEFFLDETGPKLDEKAKELLKSSGAGKATIDIIEATFGSADILDQLKQMYEEGKRDFEPSVDTWADPDEGAEKELKVKYEINGKEEVVTAKENSGITITLPDGVLKSSGVDDMVVH